MNMIYQMNIKHMPIYIYGELDYLINFIHFKQIEDFLEKNKDVKRNLKKSLENSIFLINTNELTKYKAYDNSGNCFNLEINIGLIKKIYDVEPLENIRCKYFRR